MKHKVAQLTAVCVLTIGLLLASGVSAAVRHTEPLPASFIATARSAVPPDSLVGSDLNGDGFEGPDDLHQIVSLFGYTALQSSPADLNGDLVFDVLDIAMVARYFGQPVNSVSP